MRTASLLRGAKLVNDDAGSIPAPPLFIAVQLSVRDLIV